SGSRVCRGNGLHGARGGTPREDARRIRKGSGPQVLAILTNIGIFVFKRFKQKSAASATRHYVCHPEESLKCLSISI
ncbi:MAG: hypothetical protein ACXVBV_20205, partial [Isosphaeraceae bacterium]